MLVGIPLSLVLRGEVRSFIDGVPGLDFRSKARMIERIKQCRAVVRDVIGVYPYFDVFDGTSGVTGRFWCCWRGRRGCWGASWNGIACVLVGVETCADLTI